MWLLNIHKSLTKCLSSAYKQFCIRMVDAVLFLLLLFLKSESRQISTYNVYMCKPVQTYILTDWCCKHVFFFVCTETVQQQHT